MSEHRSEQAKQDVAALVKEAVDRLEEFGLTEADVWAGMRRVGFRLAPFLEPNLRDVLLAGPDRSNLPPIAEEWADVVEAKLRAKLVGGHDLDGWVLPSASRPRA